jgi:hypothetical protein
MTLVNPPGRAEEAWTWLCRGLAVVGFGFLLATTGFRAPMGAYLLLLGLFFGPEVIRGQLTINRQSKNEDDGPK